jgi:hypothetical protein
LYSNDWIFETKGTFMMVSWIEDRTTKELATGKYEFTIAPHTWYKYATPEKQLEAHEQVTTCTCGANGLLYTEQKPERIGPVRVFRQEFTLEDAIGFLRLLA